MSIDNTALFRARAKIIQRRQKANTADSLSTLDGGYVSEVVEKKDDIRKPGNTTRLTFQHSNNRSHSEIASNMSQFHVYSVKAAQIRKNISDLNDLIIKHRKDYLTSLGHRRKLLPISQSMGMDERERDCIDSEIDVAIRQCSNLAFSFRTQIKADPSLRANDELPHLLQVVRSLDAYISSVVKIIAELRKIRLKKLNDKRRVSKLLTLVYLYECDINSTAKILAEPKWSRYEDSSRREMMNLGKRKNHNGGLDESKLRRRQNGRSSSSEKKLSMNGYCLLSQLCTACS